MTNQTDTIRKMKRPFADSEFPWWSAILYGFTLLFAPFISPVVMFVPFLVQIFRLLKYDISVVVTDVAFLISFGLFYSAPGGDRLLSYFILAFDIVFLVKAKGLKINSIFFLTIATLIYFAARIDGEFIIYLFVAGGLIFLYLVFSNLEQINKQWVVNGFIGGVGVSSLYPLLFDGVSAVRSQLRLDTVALIDGRFRGMCLDPNYFSVLVILALSGLMILNANGQIKPVYYYLSFIFLVYVGTLTVSKSFFLMLGVILFYYIFSFFSQKQWIKGALLLFCFIFVLIIVIQGRIPIFNNVLNRFAADSSMADLTTGRTVIWPRYWNYIINNVSVFFFGRGFDAPLLGSNGTHNIYLEIIYNVGIAGLLLMAFLFFVLLNSVKRSVGEIKKASMMRMIPIVAVGVMYFFLAGMTSETFYIQLFIMFMCYGLCLERKDEAQKINNKDLI